MRRTRGILLVGIALVTFHAATAEERHRGPTNCSRDPALSSGNWTYSAADSGFRTDYDGVWGGKIGNTNISKSAAVWASVLTTPAPPEPESDKNLLRSSEANVVTSTSADTFDGVGSDGRAASTTVVTMVSSADESTLLYSGHWPAAPSRTHQAASSYVCSASVSGLCPVVGDFNHPRSSSTVTLNNATG